MGFNPEFNHFEQWVNYGPTNGGNTPFSQNTQTYYTTARIDDAVTQKTSSSLDHGCINISDRAVRLQPYQDSTQGFFNSRNWLLWPGDIGDEPMRQQRSSPIVVCSQSRLLGSEHHH